MEGRTHVPKLNEELCGYCGVCRGACPALAAPDLIIGEQDTIRSALAPLASAGNPPCEQACPIGQDINGYVSRLAAGDRAGALEIILKDNPLPSVLGHVCHHPCQQACLSVGVQPPPSIRDLKRFAAQSPRPKPQAAAGEPVARVAVVGSGPAGLAAAWELSRLGATAVVHDSQTVAGGLLAWAIPSFRLPAEALQKDLDYILAHGVELKLGQHISPSGIGDLKREYDAVLLACGAPRAKRAGIAGEDLPGVWQGLDFLAACALGPRPKIKPPVVVVGGGNVAVDAARWALRLAGNKGVSLAYRRDREQMPAYAEEVAEAAGEGLQFEFRVQPASIEAGSLGRAAGLAVRGTAPGGPGPDGRASFEPLPGGRRVIPAATVILALGQQSEAGDWAGVLGLDALTPDENGCLAPGIYASGDLVTGPATVVEAMAGGIKAARAIVSEVQS